MVDKRRLPRSEEVRRKISNALKGIKRSEETRAKMSKAQKGRIFSEESKKNMSEAHIGKYIGSDHPGWKGGPIEYICKNCGNVFVRQRSPHIYQFCSKSCKSKYYKGILSSNWQGGKSFEPYCYLFNNELKEEIRNRDNRVCQLCDKGEILNGKRLAVHHIDGDKMQGCKGKKWHLVSLCNSCNSEKDTIEKEFLIISNLRWRI
jgi:hypothetical protein